MLKCIKHKDLNETNLFEIVNIKSIAWPYPKEKQLEWINKNIKENDIHVLLKENKKAIAYLNLINIELIINNQTYKGLGIGNVCTSEKGKGYGIRLMNELNNYLLNENKIGLLLCNKKLQSFYEKANWIKIDNRKLFIKNMNENDKVLIYNFNETIKACIFNGELF